MPIYLPPTYARYNTLAVLPTGIAPPVHPTVWGQAMDVPTRSKCLVSDDIRFLLSAGPGLPPQRYSMVFGWDINSYIGNPGFFYRGLSISPLCQARPWCEGYGYTDQGTRSINALRIYQWMYSPVYKYWTWDEHDYYGVESCALPDKRFRPYVLCFDTNSPGYPYHLESNIVWLGVGGGSSNKNLMGCLACDMVRLELNDPPRRVVSYMDQKTGLCDVAYVTSEGGTYRSGMFDPDSPVVEDLDVIGHFNGEPQSIEHRSDGMKVLFVLNSPSVNALVSHDGGKTWS